MLAEYDRGARSAGARRVLEVLHGRGLLGARAPSPAFPDEGWGEAADRIGAYLATSRDEVEDHWPPIPDHWAAYGLSETVEFPERGRPPLTDDELDYARRQAELFGVQARWLSQRSGPGARSVRGGDAPRGGWYGVIDEALTGCG